MPAPLSRQEWTVLHQAMDQVDRERLHAAATPPDAARIKAVAMATYQSQGVAVNEATLDRAIAAAVASAPPTPSRARRRGLRLDARPWLPDDPSLREPAPLAFGGPARVFRSWDAIFARLRRHQPWSAEALAARFQEAIAFQARRARRHAGMTLAALSVAAVGASMGWWALVGLGALASGWGAFRWAQTGEIRRRLRAALHAVATGDWECPLLSEAARRVGLPVLASLAPLSPDGDEWLELKALAAQHPKLKRCWEEWTPSPNLRRNDAALLGQAIHEMQHHPLHRFRARPVVGALVRWWL